MPDAARDGGVVLVTGGGGFVGANAVRRLLAAGYRVHLLNRNATPPWRLRDVVNQTTTHVADVRDADAVARAVRESGAAFVVHCAAYGAYPQQGEPSRILETNVLGTANLLRAAASAGVRLVVSAGSSSEYGYRSTAMSEGDRLEPNSWYAASKAAQTHLCSLPMWRPSLPVVTLRLFSVYGPWEEPTRLVPTIVRRALARAPLEMVAPEIARDFVYVDDVVDLMVDFDRLAGHPGEVFNVGTGRQVTLQEVVDALAEICGDLRVVWGAMPPRPWDTAAWCADTTRTAAQLGWTARRDFRRGLDEFVAWFKREHGAYAPVGR
jgi:nucleoside-diphosphate-sugar epimerase